MSLRGFLNDLVLGSSGCYLRQANVSFTNAQVLAWPTTPLTVVAAPGSGMVIDPIHLSVVADLAAGYTNINGDASVSAHTADWTTDVFSYLPNVSGSPGGLTDVTDLLSASGTRRWTPLRYSTSDQHGGFLNTNWGLPVTLVDEASAANQAFVVAFDNNGGGNLTGGNAANVVRVRLLYHVVPV